MKKKEKRRGAAPPEPSGFSRRSFIQTLGLAGVSATLPLTQGCGASETGPDVPAEGLGPAPVDVALNVNGQEVKLKVEPRVTLLDALRDHLKLGSADPVDLGDRGEPLAVVQGRQADGRVLLVLRLRDPGRGPRRLRLLPGKSGTARGSDRRPKVVKIVAGAFPRTYSRKLHHDPGENARGKGPSYETFGLGLPGEDRP